MDQNNVPGGDINAGGPAPEPVTPPTTVPEAPIIAPEPVAQPEPAVPEMPVAPVAEQPAVVVSPGISMVDDTKMFGILSIVFAFLGAVIGLVFGIIGKRRVKKYAETTGGAAKGAGLVKVGLVLSIIMLVLYLIGGVLMGIGMMEFMSPGSLARDWRCTPSSRVATGFNDKVQFTPEGRYSMTISGRSSAGSYSVVPMALNESAWHSMKSSLQDLLDITDTPPEVRGAMVEGSEISAIIFDGKSGNKVMFLYMDDVYLCTDDVSGTAGIETALCNEEDCNEIIIGKWDCGDGTSSLSGYQFDEDGNIVGHDGSLQNPEITRHYEFGRDTVYGYSASGRASTWNLRGSYSTKLFEAEQDGRFEYALNVKFSDFVGDGETIDEYIGHEVQWNAVVDPANPDKMALGMGNSYLCSRAS